MTAIRPDICVSIGNMDFHEIKAILPILPLAEIRIDLLHLNKDELRQLFTLHPNLIATYRPKTNEVGKMVNALTTAIEWGAAWIDIDITTPTDIVNQITTKTTSSSFKLILSYHNYAETPSLKTLNKLIANARENNPTLIKIACMANSAKDCTRILSLYENHSNLLAFCMGSLGMITRLAAPLLGAPFTYASLQGKLTAPGQIDYIKLNELLNNIKPF